MDINGILLAERTSLLRKLKQLNLELKDLPQGQIYFVRNGKNWRWCIRETDKDGKTVRTRLSKSKRSYASELSYRRFLEQNRYRIEKRLQMIDQFYQDYPALLSFPYALEEPCTEYRDLLGQELEEVNMVLEQWKSESYRTKPDKREQCIFKTKAGVMVRSKSEMMIADMLYDRGIPFRYEEEMRVSSAVFYPDFKILRGKSPGEYVIWEHFGMMDDPSYFNKVLEKLRLLYQAGFSVEKGNLICTFESRVHPLEPEMIEFKIACFL